jgi:hypothetical protein
MALRVMYCNQQYGVHSTGTPSPGSKLLTLRSAAEGAKYG